MAVLPFDPVKQAFLLVEQFRIGLVARGVHPWNLEIVAGFMDVDGENELATAKRELLEETGCECTNIHPLISYYPGPGGSGSKIHVFVAEIDVEKAVRHTGLKEEGEDIRVHRVSVNDLQQKLAAGEIDNATSIIAFQQFFLNNWLENCLLYTSPSPRDS